MAGKVENRPIAQITKNKHCLEEIFNLSLKDKVRIY